MSKKKFLDLTGLKKYDEGVKNALRKKADKDKLPKIVHGVDENTDKNAVPTVGAITAYVEDTYVRKDSPIDAIELEAILD